MRNQATIASFRIVAAEAGGVPAPGAETARAVSERHGWLNQADSRQCEHGYNRFPHRSALPLWSPPVKHNTFAAGLFGGRSSFAVN
jgi:hypothetical protein